MRRVHTEQRLLQIDAQRGRILGAETAELLADAGLHGANGFAVGVAVRHVQVLPDFRQVIFLDAQQVDALATGDLDHRHLVLVGNIRNAAQLGSIGHAAEHAGHHRVGAVFLDIGVGALVDEARLRVVLRFARPGGDEVVVQRRAAGGAAVGRAPVQVAHHIRNADQVLLDNGFAHLPMRQITAPADGFFALGLYVRRTADGVHQDLFDQPGAGAAGAGRLGVLLHVVNGEQPVFLNRLDDVALAHTVAAADFHAVGHGHGLVLTLMTGVTDGAFTEHQVITDFAYIVAFANLTEIPATIGGVAVQASADEDVVLDHQLLVDPADGVGEGDGLGAFTAEEIASGEQVDAGDLELGRGHRAEVAGETEHRQVVGADLGLLEQRRH